MPLTTQFTFYQGPTKQTVSSIDTIVTETDKVFPVLTSPVNSNNNDRNSINVNLVFSNIVPDPELATAKGWKIGANVELEGEGWFVPVGGLFAPLQDPGQGLRHVIIIQPNVFNINEGTPLDIFDTAGGITRISRQQGIIGTSFRVSLEVSDQFAGTSDALQSFDVEIFGELYNA